jgi:flagellar motor component MotA
LRNTLCCAAAVGTLVGLVLMLQNMSDPTHIGPAMAVALLSGLYGVGCGELLVAPMVHRFNYAQSTPPQVKDEGARSAMIAMAIIGANMVSFFVMLMSFMEMPA